MGIFAQSTITIKHRFYQMEYDTVFKAEIIGYYIQTKQHALISMDKTKSVIRTSIFSEFTQDPLIPANIQEIVTNNVYKNWNKNHKTQRVDKGHIVPFSAMDFDSTAALESMFIENTLPQVSYFNEHQWEEVEMYILKNIAPKYDSVKVWTGTLVYRTSQRIGELYKPDYYWKVVEYKKDGVITKEAWLGLNDWNNLSTNPNDIKIDLNKLKPLIKLYYPKLKLEF
jgi:DNA/RNA endonuclease G (NUC1)